MQSLKSAGCVFLREMKVNVHFNIAVLQKHCSVTLCRQWTVLEHLPELQKLATYCYLNPTDLIYMLSLLSKEYCQSKSQNSSMSDKMNQISVLTVMKRLSSSSLRQPKCSFLKYLAKTGITIPSPKWTTKIYYVWPNRLPLANFPQYWTIFSRRDIMWANIEKRVCKLIPST